MRPYHKPGEPKRFNQLKLDLISERGAARAEARSTCYRERAEWTIYAASERTRDPSPRNELEGTSESNTN